MTSNSSAALSAATVEPAPLETQVTPAEKHTYGQILKSSALVGGSSILNIGVGILRTKVMAILLGPAGVGLVGLYSSISDLTQSIAGMGVNSSGVRQIAEAVGTQNTERIALTATVLRRVSIVLGLLGSLLLVVFSRQVSRLTFGNSTQATAVSFLSIAVFFRLVSSGQGALIQGTRRIADLAKMSVLGAVFGTVISIPLVYFFGQSGIVPSLIGVAAMTIIPSWWYSRKIQIESRPIVASRVRQEAAALLKLGFAFMTSSLMTMGVAYVVRITVLRKIGVEATGLYQSAWTLGGLYVGFVLQAMGADFYPRLAAHANDDMVCNRLVNEQALIGLLIAGPGVIATLTFAPLVIALFYTAKFAGAVAILRWISLGATLQVITWPMGFIIVAKGNQTVFFLSELAWTLVAVALAWVCIGSFGVNGAGIAFFGSYVFHGILTYPIVRRLSGFRWSSENVKKGLLLLSLIALVFAGFYALPFLYAVCIGIGVTAASGAYSIRVLLKLVPWEQIPRQLKPLLALFRLRTAGI